MRDLSPEAMSWLQGHHGVITTSALRTCGVGRSTIDRLCRAGVLDNPHKGVYVLAASQPTIHRRCAVLCAAHPTGFVTGPTGGMLIGLRRMPTSSGLHFAVRHGIHLPVEMGVVFRQTTARHAQHIDHRSDGIAIATPVRLAFDLAADLPALDHLSVLHQLVDQRRVTTEQLVAVGIDLCHPARRGSKRFTESLHRLRSGPASQSHPEVVLGEQLRLRGVPVEPQRLVLRDAAGRRAAIDLAVPAVRWGVELDIHPEHRSVEGHSGDARRYRDLHRVDWQIEPVSEADMADVTRLADELTILYQARCRQVALGPSVS
jgi:hypothetical protein